MDALVALGFTSLLAAAGFTATGYFLARSGLLGAPPKDAPATRATEAPAAPAARATPSHEPAAALEIVTPEQPVPHVPPGRAARHVPPAPSHHASGAFPAHASSYPPKRDPRREDDSTRATVPPPDAELERQLAALRSALSTEARARDLADAHVKELELRLGTMTERLLTLDARTRDSLRAPRGDMPRSLAPPSGGASRERLASLAPGLFAELEELKATVAHLTAENESLRGR